ncbi:ParB/RepB/Spo0J family partition protein [Candidatus Jorgensenbacteria bacterium]|nr:ParB/RepB/Spo0J family partition protein [Candidatus Jorgensenbacteria bacterium]
MSGRGLEALIPKKNTSVQTEVNRAVSSNSSPAPIFSPRTPPVSQSSTSPKTYESKSHPISYTPQAFHPEPLPNEPSGTFTEDSIRYTTHAWKVYPPIHQPKKDFTPSESIFHIEVDKIKPNPYQPRHEFNPEGIEELAQSIREFGILQPLVVSKSVKETEVGTYVEYQLIAGERRLLAAKRVGLERVPAIVKTVDLERAKLEMALIENIQRSNLNVLEAAKAYSRLQDEFGLTQREIATRVGKSREVVANAMRLLNLPGDIQVALSQGKISESQARALLSMDNIKQTELFKELLDKKSTVRELRQKALVSHDPQVRYWENKFEEKLGAPVKVVKHGDRGKVVVHFYSNEEWQNIIDNLLGDVND